MFMTPERVKVRTHNHTMKFPLYLYEWAKDKAQREGKTITQIVFDSMREAKRRDDQQNKK